MPCYREEVPVRIEICEKMFVKIPTMLNKCVRERGENEGEGHVNKEGVLTTH